MIAGLKRRRRGSETASRLCAAVTRQARKPLFYQAYGVADTIDGRFDLLALHAWLVMERLKEAGEAGLAQNFVDAVFVHFDEALREQGVGDIGIGRRMKTMAGAFYGRLAAYSGSGDETALAGAILRNVYRGDSSRVDCATSLARYIAVARRQMAGGDPVSGDLQFAAVPAP